MTWTCPAGHTSAAEDYCDVCGLPIGEVPEPATPVSSDPVSSDPVSSDPVVEEVAQQPSRDLPSAATCPNCQAVNPANALFCEACGYDFTTGSLPRPVAPTAPASPTDPVLDLPPAEPVAPVLPEVDGWVAEIWIDPDWYADQQSTDPMPSPGLPTVLALRNRSLLVGRASASRGIHPDIDLSSDSGISRRHCQLTTDGARWWVEDLGSSNGTFVADAVGPLPTAPLVQGQKRELDGDDRIYLGAWTRLVIRKAEPGEI